VPGRQPGKMGGCCAFELILRFISGTDDCSLRDIELILAEIKALTLEVVLGRIGYFPARGMAKILWAGAEANPLLERLRFQLVTKMAALDLKPEQQKFAPHITLSRFQRGTILLQIGEFISEHTLFRTAPFTVGEFHLYSSPLRP
jgi:RNA 2',3'-cyclic 3'-phosphodiesterase